MKSVKVKRPRYFWADYSYAHNEYIMVELRLYAETRSDYQGRTYYHHRHILNLEWQANKGKFLNRAYCLSFKYENEFGVEDAHRIVGRLIKQNSCTVKQVLRSLKKMGIPKYIYSSEPYHNFVPYEWRNNREVYFRLLA